MIRTVVLDIGETLTRDDRYWAARADWLGVPRHTLSALVGAVVVDGRDNADAIRLLHPGIDSGPWGHWWADGPEVRVAADWSIDSLTELPDLVTP